jgi:hypothetical protein
VIASKTPDDKNIFSFTNLKVEVPSNNIKVFIKYLLNE